MCLSIVEIFGFGVGGRFGEIVRSSRFHAESLLLFIVENMEEDLNKYFDRIALFLYYDTPNFDKSILEFSDIIKPKYNGNFMFMSYQYLFSAMENSFLYTDKNMAWFDYMGKRYFKEIA